MNRKGLTGTIVIGTLTILLAVILAVSCFVVKNYMIIDWQLFPKNQAELDLRSRTLSAQTYDNLLWYMPHTQIRWSVPFQGGYYDSDSQELTITSLQYSDLEMLVYFPQLKTIQAQSCTDYAVLKALYQRYPNVEILYTVPIGGQSYGPEARTVTPETLTQEDVQRLAYLPNLTRVDGTNCREFQLLQQLQREHPEWEVLWRTTIAGTPINPDARSLEVEAASYQELYVGLAAMPQLQALTIHSPQATGQELIQLREEYPNVSIHWDIEIFGKYFPDDTAQLDISHQRITSVQQAKDIASHFPQLTKLIVDSTGIDNEEMAAYREEVRSSYRVVWTVILSSKCKARTDDLTFMPIQQGEYYFSDQYSYNLRYCEEMECIDIGDAPAVKNIDFVAFMPHLKYLILAWSGVQDISPLSNCKELVYLELDHCVVRDYTPLQGCTALEDLNINDQDYEVSIDPLLSMTWLKTLWVPTRSGADKQKLIDALPNTRVVTTNQKTTFLGKYIRCPEGLGWRNLENYYDMRDMLGMYYMK